MNAFYFKCKTETESLEQTTLEWKTNENKELDYQSENYKYD